MKKILTFLILLSSLAFAVKDANNSHDKKRMDAQIRKQMEDEKKFAKEQKFYQGDDYDLKGAEINEESLKKLPVIKPEYDFDMTHVYD